MPFRICMVSDFFYPNMGGVEEHIYNLSQCLIAKGHKVVVLTHSYDDRIGVMYNQSVLPSFICDIPIFRYIYIRESIEIVHGHSTFSSLCHEGIMVASTMGLKTVFTDHSLFGFADTSAVVTNKLLEVCLSVCNHCICVSHTGKENTVLRARVNCDRVSVIPNAVDAAMFYPKMHLRMKDITIVIVSRLVYRKGVDFMAQIIPNVCHRYPKVNFLIAGDGPKRWLLEEVRERQSLQHRVTLLGAIEHSQVSDVLNKGHVFLNTSLTEAYCMAIVEAASCGLLVVSTKVGGIPEVLPEDMIYLTEANVPALLQGIDTALSDLNNDKNVCPYTCNTIIRELYNWENIAARTEVVYQRVSKERIFTLGERLYRYLSHGIWPWIVVGSFHYLMQRLLDILVPRENIDIAKDVHDLNIGTIYN